MKHVHDKLLRFRDTIIREETRQADLKNRLNVIEEKTTTLAQEQKLLRASRNLLEKSNIISRNHVKEEVEKLVTQGLRTIFEDPHIEFNIVFTTKRNQTEADFFVARGENSSNRITGDILSTHGGGLVDIISISLRIIIMQLLHIKGPLLLDEPGKNISAQFIHNFGTFLTQIAKTFDRQIIMITHNEQLAMFAEKTFKVAQFNDVSKVFIE